MDQGLVPSPATSASTAPAPAGASRIVTRSAPALFGAELRRSPLRTVLFLFVEYAMFASAVFLALGLFLTRVPLRITDRVFGLRLRQRFVDGIARLSPG
jgi:hypothetical protein